MGRGKQAQVEHRDLPLGERPISLVRVMEELNELIRRGQVELQLQITGASAPVVAKVGEAHAWLTGARPLLRLEGRLDSAGGMWGPEALGLVAYSALVHDGKRELARLGEIMVESIINTHLAAAHTLTLGEPPGAPEEEATDAGD